MSDLLRQAGTSCRGLLRYRSLDSLLLGALFCFFFKEKNGVQIAFGMEACVWENLREKRYRWRKKSSREAFT